jgi:hypothetical protein
MVEKLAEITSLLNRLQSDLDKPQLLPPQRDALLEHLKVLGRNPQDADPIFTRQGVEVLARHAFNSPSYNTSRNALRCLANAMLLRPATRQMWVDLHYEAKGCQRLKHDDRDDEFLVSRIIFLTTYGTNIDISALLEQHHLGEIIAQNIHRHATALAGKKKKKQDEHPMEDMALIESLKLMFNLSHFCPTRASDFTAAIPDILTILQRRALDPSKPLEPPTAPLVNALINADLADPDSMHALFPKSDAKVHAERLIDLFNLAIQAYKEEELDAQVSPLLTLLRKVYELAPQDVKRYIKAILLPNDEDRQQVLGRTESLASRMLRLSTSPVAPQVREAISNLLFEMSDKDAQKFVRNVGYGFASGYLFQHDVPLPDMSKSNHNDETWSTSESEARSSSSSQRKHPQFNPVTGQDVQYEKVPDGPKMTKEEKAREAERLMVLFDRYVVMPLADVMVC